jgi:hypothetical protein
MRKIKLFFDIVDYIVVRLLLVTLLILGAITLFMQHWPWRH